MKSKIIKLQGLSPVSTGLRFFVCIFLVLMISCSEKNKRKTLVGEEINSCFSDWPKQVVWYQIFPDRFCNGDTANDPKLIDQKGCWPHELIEPWQVHPWSSDWYELQAYEKENGEDLWYNISRRRYGGDIQGIINKLDYLKDLGITALYLNPVFMAPSLHKYDIAYYHHIDPTFGPNPEEDKKIIENEIPDDPSTWKWTSADSLALKLIEEVHKRGMKIIFDGVFNHVGYTNFAIQDVMKNQKNSRFKDWFTIKSWEDTIKNTILEYEAWWGIKDMPELREDSNGLVAGPKKYIFDITKRWMDPDGNGNTNKGIDGWRLDVAYCVAHPFWKDWRKHVKKINPEAYITAEIIDSTQKIPPYLQGDEFDGVMNYNFQFICSEYFINKHLKTSDFDSLLENLRNSFPENAIFVSQNLLGSHDTDRPSSRILNKGKANFLVWEPYFNDSKAGNQNYKTGKPSTEDYGILKLMVVFQMTYPGAPMIYYGDEIGMWGANDPCCRKPMIWEEICYDDEKYLPNGEKRKKNNEVKANLNLKEHYKKLINIRNSNLALQLGDFKTLKTNNNKIYAFSRTYKGETIFVVLNNDNKKQKVELDINSNKPIFDILNNRKVNNYKGSISLEIKGNWAAILKEI